MIRRLIPLGVLIPLAACGSTQKMDVAQQFGANPVLPEPSEELVAAVGVPKVVGWERGAMPSVPAGFKIEPFATGLTNPRNVYPLANGDILVVESQRVGSEPVQRPKDPIRKFIMSLAHGRGTGSSGGPPQRITLLRDADGDGKAELKSVLVDHLNSPFGVAVVGNDLYVANTASTTPSGLRVKRGQDDLEREALPISAPIPLGGGVPRSLQTGLSHICPLAAAR